MSEKRNRLINKLTLIDTSLYRKATLFDDGICKKEPLGFRSKLFDIYSKLSNEDIEIILKLKEL